MRDLEGDLSILQRVVEFLPIPSSTCSRNTVKALSRAWRTAARRALTRGRWKPLRTLEDRGVIGSETYYEQLEPEARRAFDRDAREAWALYPGEVLLMLISEWSVAAACDYLSLVVERTKQGFGSIVAAFEKSLQLKRRNYSDAILCLLGEWMRQAMPGSLPDDTMPRSMRLERERLASPEWLGDALGRWADPALAAKVVDVLINDYHHNWHPRYDDLARSMSANWTDSGKRARFVARFVERQAQEDADIATADAEAPPIADDGMYNHL